MIRVRAMRAGEAVIDRTYSDAHTLQTATIAMCAYLAIEGFDLTAIVIDARHEWRQPA